MSVSGRGPARSPGIPHDDGGPVVVTESAWARLKRWHLHAPAERLPLPAVLFTWPAAWVMHWAARPCPCRRLPRWRGHCCDVAGVGAAAPEASVPGQDRAGAGAGPVPADRGRARRRGVGWVGYRRCRVRSHSPAGPVANRPLPGGGGWAGTGGSAIMTRSGRPASAAMTLAAELADKKRWHEILPRIGLGGWHVQWRRDTLIGEERLITTSPENALATRIAGASSRDR